MCPHPLSQIPAGAVINCSSNGLHLAQPSTKQETAIAAVCVAHFVYEQDGESSRTKALHSRCIPASAPPRPAHPPSHTQAETERRVVPSQEAAVLKPLLGKRTAAQVQYNDSKFVRKRAKAPNPLSCRPKQKKERARRAPANSNTGEGQGGGDKEAQNGEASQRSGIITNADAGKTKARKHVRRAKQVEVS